MAAVAAVAAVAASLEYPSAVSEEQEKSLALKLRLRSESTQ